MVENNDENNDLQFLDECQKEKAAGKYI